MTIKAYRFIEANKISPVVYGAAIGTGGQGAIYRLADNKTFTLTAEECRLVEPRWAFETAA